MDKEEYYKIKKQRVLEMSIETLRQRYFDLDEIARGYFKKMNAAIKELDETKVALSVTQSQLSEKDKEINALKEQVKWVNGTPLSEITDKDCIKVAEIIGWRPGNVPTGKAVIKHLLEDTMDGSNKYTPQKVIALVDFLRSKGYKIQSIYE